MNVLLKVDTTERCGCTTKCYQEEQPDAGKGRRPDKSGKTPRTQYTPQNKTLAHADTQSSSGSVTGSFSLTNVAAGFKIVHHIQEVVQKSEQPFL